MAFAEEAMYGSVRPAEASAMCGQGTSEGARNSRNIGARPQHELAHRIDHPCAGQCSTPHQHRMPQSTTIRKIHLDLALPCAQLQQGTNEDPLGTAPARIGDQPPVQHGRAALHHLAALPRAQREHHVLDAVCVMKTLLTIHMQGTTARAGIDLGQHGTKPERRQTHPFAPAQNREGCMCAHRSRSSGGQ